MPSERKTTINYFQRERNKKRTGHCHKLPVPEAKDIKHGLADVIKQSEACLVRDDDTLFNVVNVRMRPLEHEVKAAHRRIDGDSFRPYGM